MTPADDFGALLRHFRRSAGLSQEHLAERSGVSARAVSQLERGRVARPRASSIRLLADALDLAGDDRSRFTRAAFGPAEPEPAPASPPPRRTPAELPAAVSTFIGRIPELASLDALLGDGAYDGGPDGPDVPAVAVIAGPAGVGKTALAVRWAHRVADRFPDGQLFVDLRGYSADAPVEPGDALARMLAAVGVPDTDLPVSVDARAARYRTELATRRMLVVLDNAVSGEQVRPLLPGTASVPVLVTSRDTLAGLVATRGARRLVLDPLPLPESLRLMGALVGPARFAAEPRAAARLVEQCARLPLALRLAAELASSRATSTLDELAAELTDPRNRLAMFSDRGDRDAAVATVFSWSYKHVPADAARAFRLYAVHPGSDLEPAAAAALIGTDRPTADRLLAALARAHLIQRTGTGRYAMHDLLRAYAGGLCAEEESDDDRHAALVRLFDHYLSRVEEAVGVVYRIGSRAGRPGDPGSGPTGAGASPAAAVAWIDSERRNLVAVCATSAAAGLPRYAIRIADLLLQHLIAGHLTDGRSIYRHAVAAADACGDLTAQARLRSGLGLMEMATGRYDVARTLHTTALRTAVRIGDVDVQASVLDRLGLLEARAGDLVRALDYHREAIELFRRLGARLGLARSLGNLSNTLWRIGRDGEAATQLGEAVDIFTEVDDRTGQATALSTLAAIDFRAGRYAEATELNRRAIAMYAAVGHRSGEARAMSNLGMVHTSVGRYVAAIELHTRALAAFREAGDRAGEAQALNGIGDALYGEGHHDGAARHHLDALAAARDGGNRDEEARAHAGLGRCLAATGDVVNARTHLETAVRGFDALRSVRAAQARADLARLDGTP